MPGPALAAIVLAAVVGGYLVAYGGAPARDGDSAGYLQVAVDLADGSLSRPYMRAPGYPLFLLAAGAVPEPGAALVAAQLVAHVGAVGVWVALLRRLRASRAAIAAFVLVAIAPPFVEHARFVLSEAPTELCVSSGVAGFALFLLGASPGWLALAAVGLACVGVVHPTYQLLWLWLPLLGLAFRALVAADLPSRRRLLAGSAVLAAAAVPLLAFVILGNFHRFGFASVSPMLGATLSHKTVRVLERLPAEYDGVRDVLIRHRDAALLDPETQHLGLAYIFRAIPELEERTGLHGPALDRYLVAMNLALVRRAPMDYVDEVLRSSVWYWSPGVTDVSGFGSGAVKAAWNALRAGVLLAFGVSVLLLVGPSVLVVGRLRAHPSGSRADPPADLETLLVVWLALGTIAYSWVLSTALTAAVYRLRIPVDLAILAVCVLAPGLFRSLSRRLATSPGTR